MHGMGYYHSHIRPDRDRHIKVLWDKIIPSKKNQFELCSSYCDTWGLVYDCASVMHYARDHMAATAGETTMGKNNNDDYSYTASYMK